MSMEPMDAIVELRAIETAVPMTKDATVAGAASKVSTATQPGVSSQTAGLQDEEERPVMSTRKRLRNMAALSGLFTTLFISALNATIVATAVPTISSEFKSAAGYAWIGGAYILANTAAAPIWVKLSDIFGRKSILLTAVAIYFFASILCAISTSMKMLIATRAFQGVAGGGLVQLVFATVSDLFSMRERSLYLGFLEVMWAIAGGTGPVLGGFFAEYVSWRWIFWINLPVSGTAFLLLFFFLDVHNPRTPLVAGLKAIDWYGCTTMLGVMVMLLLGLDLGGTAYSWQSPTVICLISFSGLMAMLFIFAEKKLAKYPVLPLDIFNDRSNVASLAFGFFHDFAVVCLEYYLPLFFQSVLGRSPLLSGALSVPLSVTMGLGGIACGVIIHRTGRYLEVIYVGSIIFSLGTGLLTRITATSTVPTIIAFEIVTGLAAGQLFEPALVALQAHLPQSSIATATSTAGLLRNLASCFAVVLAGAIFQHGMEHQVADLQAAGLSPGLVDMLTSTSSAANVGLIGKIEDPAQRFAVRKAYARGLQGIWITCAVMAASLTVCGVFISKKHLSDVHEETRTGISGHDETTTGISSQVDTRTGISNQVEIRTGTSSQVETG